MQQQRKLPSKRYSSYMPAPELASLEDHVPAFPPSSSQPDRDVVNMRKNSAGASDKTVRRQSLNTLHFDALQNAVSKLSRIDDFHLEELGYGFFSDVFKVTHKQSGKVMVLKRNKDTNTKLNILREVQLMNRLSHPNILKFFGVCVHEGQLHALTEFINGGDLDQLVQQKNTVYLSWSVRIQLALDIARGLQYLHSMGIFHRDLTAKNCLIRVTTTPRQVKEYSAVVADLGLAEKIPSTLEQKQKLRTVGTPYCMAPEVLTSKPYDERSDFFSFGIIICQLIICTTSDPDKFPRSNDFGVKRDIFRKLTLKGVGAPELATGKSPLSMPPDGFLQLGFDCTEVDPAKRPCVKDIVCRLEQVFNEEKQSTKSKISADSVKESNTPLGDISTAIAKSPHETKSMQVPCSASSEDNKENASPAKSPPAVVTPRRPSCSRLSRSSSDVSNELISHAATIIASSHNISSRLGEESDMSVVVSSLNEAFINPFSNLEETALQEKKLYDLPSSEVLEMTFDLPAPKPPSRSPKRTGTPHIIRRIGSRPRHNRPRSLLLDPVSTDYTNTTRTIPVSPKMLTPEPQSDIPKLSQLCEDRRIESDSHRNHHFDLRQDPASEQQRLKKALIRSVAFSPQGRSLLSWWSNHQRSSDWRSMTSVLSIMTDKMGPLKRSISMPDLTQDTAPLLALSSGSPFNSSSSRSSVSSEKGSPRSSLSAKPPSGSRFNPNAYPAYVTLPRKKKSRCQPCNGDRNRRLRSKTSDDVFTDDSTLEILHEETSDLRHSTFHSTNTTHCTCSKPPLSPRREVNNNNSKSVHKLRPSKPCMRGDMMLEDQENKEDFHLEEGDSSYLGDGNVSSSSTSSGTSTNSGYKMLLHSGVVSCNRRKVGSHPPQVEQSETHVAECCSNYLLQPCLHSDKSVESPPNVSPAPKDCRTPRSNRDSGYEDVFSIDTSSDSQSSFETTDSNIGRALHSKSAAHIAPSSNETRCVPDYTSEIAPRCKIKEREDAHIGKRLGKSH